jgi:hypothetical protein
MRREREGESLSAESSSGLGRLAGGESLELGVRLRKKDFKSAENE